MLHIVLHFLPEARNYLRARALVSGSGRAVCPQEMGDQFCEVGSGAFAFRYSMRAVGVGHNGK